MLLGTSRHSTLCRYYKMNIGSNEMSDAYSIIVSDCEKFTSLLSNVIWRPTNLTSLASASLGASAVKPSSFLCAFVFSSVSVYDFYLGFLQIPICFVFA